MSKMTLNLTILPVFKTIRDIEFCNMYNFEMLMKFLCLFISIKCILIKKYFLNWIECIPGNLKVLVYIFHLEGHSLTSKYTKVWPTTLYVSNLNLFYHLHASPCFVQYCLKSCWDGVCYIVSHHLLYRYSYLALN